MVNGVKGGFRRISLSKLMVFGLLATTTIANIIGVIYQEREASKSLVHEQRELIERTMTGLGPLLKAKPELAIDLLDSQARLGWINFYRLRKSGQDFATTSNLYNYDLKSIPEEVTFGRFKEGDTNYYLTRHQFGEWDAIVGVFDSNIAPIESINVKAISVVLFLNTILLVFVGWYLVRDMRIQAKIMESRDRSGLSNYVALTREGELFQKLYAIAETKQEKAFLQAILRAEKVVLALDETVPRSFNGALIRIDMNDFGENSARLGYVVMAGLMENVFNKIRDLAQRFQAFETRDVGDERIYLIAGKDKKESLQLAVNFVRAAFEHLKAEKPFFVEHTRKELSFTYKASISYGEVTIKHQDENYKLEGEVYVFTQRYLDALKSIKGPKDFTLIMSSEDKDLVKDYLINPKVKRAALKSYGETEIMIAREFVDVSQNPELWWYARAPKDIFTILKGLYEDFNEERFFEFYKACRDYEVYAADGSTREFVFGLLAKRRELNLSGKVIATLVALTGHLYTSEVFEEKYLEEIRGFLYHSNERVVANAVEVLGRLEAMGDAAKDFVKMESNRSAVNALIALGIENVDDFVRDHLVKRLREPGGDVRVLIGALYAIKTLMEHYLVKDAILLATNKIFSELYQEAIRYTSHENPTARELSEFIEKHFKKWIFPN